jgi:hypothetical protein
MMSPRLRKLALIAHVTCSVGWLGSIAGFLALAIAGLASSDHEVTRAAYVGMDLVAWFAIVPLCFASLVTGLVQSLGTSWGLVRHYWVLIKLVLTVISTIILMIHMRPIGQLAEAALQDTLAEHRGARIQLVVDAAAAIVVLVVNVVLSIVKPRGLTRHGRRVVDAA